MADPSNYEAVLADLRARRDKLNDMITGLEELALGKTTPEGDTLPNGAPLRAPVREHTSGAIPSDAFFAMSATEAARKYLLMNKGPAGAKQIEDALRLGGFQTIAKNFYSNLYTSLSRADDVFIKVGKKWGLVEWYPGRRGKKGDASANESDEG